MIRNSYESQLKKIISIIMLGFFLANFRFQIPNVQVINNKLNNNSSVGGSGSNSSRCSSSRDPIDNCVYKFDGMQDVRLRVERPNHASPNHQHQQHHQQQQAQQLQQHQQQTLQSQHQSPHKRPMHLFSNPNLK